MIDKDAFEQLEPDKQAEVFRQSPMSEMGELLRYAHEPEQLTRSLSQEELYLVTREMDEAERSEIIRYATVSQLFFISDMDCWQKDRLDPKGFVNWLETLEKADEKRLFVWLAEMDFETVVAGFKKIVHVAKPDWEYASDEVLADMTYFTIDQRYYISVREENLATVKRALELLFEHHRGRYTAVLEGVIAELDDLIEEDAYRKRENRLLDRGFPDTESALKIYNPISEKDYLAFPLKNEIEAKVARDPSEDIPSPNYLALWGEEKLFLDEVLNTIPESNHALAESVQEELAWLANKVIACEGIDFSSEERVKRGVERARCVVSVGLEFLSGGDIETAGRILKERWLETVFRRAVGLYVQGRVRIQKVIREFWQGDTESFLQYAGMPYEGVLKGVLRPLPEYFDLGHKDQSYPWRDFESLLEVEQTGLALEQIVLIHQTLSRRVPQVFKTLQTRWDEDLEHPTLFSTLGTLFVSFTVSGKASLEALDKKQVMDFCRKAFEAKGRRKRLAPEVKEAFLKDWHREGDSQKLLPLWAFVFEALEDDLGSLSGPDVLDLRFVHSFRTQVKGMPS